MKKLCLALLLACGVFLAGPGNCLASPDQPTTKSETDQSGRIVGFWILIEKGWVLEKISVHHFGVRNAWKDAGKFGMPRYVRKNPRRLQAGSWIWLSVSGMLPASVEKLSAAAAQRSGEIQQELKRLQGEASTIEQVQSLKNQLADEKKRADNLVNELKLMAKRHDDLSAENQKLNQIIQRQKEMLSKLDAQNEELVNLLDKEKEKAGKLETEVKRLNDLIMSPQTPNEQARTIEGQKKRIELLEARIRELEDVQKKASEGQPDKAKSDLPAQITQSMIDELTRENERLRKRNDEVEKLPQARLQASNMMMAEELKRLSLLFKVLTFVVVVLAVGGIIWILAIRRDYRQQLMLANSTIKQLKQDAWDKMSKPKLKQDEPGSET